MLSRIQRVTGDYILCHEDYFRKGHGGAAVESTEKLTVLKKQLAGMRSGSQTSNGCS